MSNLSRKRHPPLSLQIRSGDRLLPWYLVHCDPRRDRQVEHLVTLNGFEAYSPRVPTTRRRNGDKPLFPGYVFTRLDLDRGHWPKISFLPGIRALVQIGSGPTSVDESIVCGIRERVARGVFRPAALRPGQRVRVVDGAFRDLEGVFYEELSGSERVAILIEMMRRQVRMELPIEGVLPASA